jgi:hypothetical protein
VTADMPRRKAKLSLYVALSLLFWLLALGPGGGCTDGVQVYWQGAVVNLLLLLLCSLWSSAEDGRRAASVSQYAWRARP